MKSRGRRTGTVTAGRTLLALILAVLFLQQGAGADLAGKMEQRTAVMGKSDAALIGANPLLRRLLGVNPDALREALERLRSPVASRRRSLERLEAAPEEDESGVLADNPDIKALHRESPEAALDLIRLIREAAKEK
ncbi:MAG: hypothetical protein OXE76_08755 [Alphaproteobacteria bacterium]|nr:hypothetical protein [Alphaproteobacteria bacterium]